MTKNTNTNRYRIPADQIQTLEIVLPRSADANEVAHFAYINEAAARAQACRAYSMLPIVVLYGDCPDGFTGPALCPVADRQYAAGRHVQL